MEEREETRLRLVQGSVDSEPRKNSRHARSAVRRRRGVVRDTMRRQPAKGRFAYGMKAGHHIAGYEELRGKRASATKRKRKWRYRELPMRQRNKNVEREFRTLDEKGRQDVWERGVEQLHDLWLGEHMRWMEPFLDGWYSERLADGRTRWEHLGDGDETMVPPIRRRRQDIDTWSGDGETPADVPISVAAGRVGMGWLDALFTDEAEDPRTS